MAPPYEQFHFNWERGKKALKSNIYSNLGWRIKSSAVTFEGCNWLPFHGATPGMKNRNPIKQISRCPIWRLDHTLILNLRGCDFYRLIVLRKISFLPKTEASFFHTPPAMGCDCSYSIDRALHISHHVLLLTDDYSLRKGFFFCLFVLLSPCHKHTWLQHIPLWTSTHIHTHTHTCTRTHTHTTQNHTCCWEINSHPAVSMDPSETPDQLLTESKEPQLVLLLG